MPQIDFVLTDIEHITPRDAAAVLASEHVTSELITIGYCDASDDVFDVSRISCDDDYTDQRALNVFRDSDAHTPALAKTQTVKLSIIRADAPSYVLTFRPPR